MKKEDVGLIAGAIYKSHQEASTNNGKAAGVAGHLVGAGVGIKIGIAVGSLLGPIGIPIGIMIGKKLGADLGRKAAISSVEGDQPKKNHEKKKKSNQSSHYQNQSQPKKKSKKREQYHHLYPFQTEHQPLFQTEHQPLFQTEHQPLFQTEHQPLFQTEHQSDPQPLTFQEFNYSEYSYQTPPPLQPQPIPYEMFEDVDSNESSYLQETYYLLSIENHLHEITQFQIRASDFNIVIGRSEDCDIILEMSDISRRHANIYLDRGNIYITDLNSSNGTFIDNTKIYGTAKVFEYNVLKISNYQLMIKKII